MSQGLSNPLVVTVARVSDPPVIDGAVDDPCWQACENFSGFRETSRSREASQPTDVMVCSDRDHLYVAFICHDSQPSLIHAEEERRNYNIGSDDHVSVLIDTLHTHLSYYSFSVNAAGAQNESIPTGAASNITWRGDWRAAAKRTDDGWCAEMCIPYRGLRYPSRCDCFGIAFSRYIPRQDETSVWPDLGPNFDIIRFADLRNLDLPIFGGRPVLMPYMVYSSQAGDSMSRTGLDFKQELPNNIIAMMTYNPDFTDVQDAVTSIAYSYTERFRPERRPFFQEGYDLFPDRLAFYSSRIEDIDVGAKSFGRVGRNAFAFMNATKRGESNHFASTYAYDAGRNAGVAVFATGSTVKQQFKDDPSEPDNSMCFSPGAFVRKRMESGTLTLAARQYVSVNTGMPSASAWNVSLGKDATSGHLGYSVNYSKTDSDYYVRDAYIPLPGVRGVSGGLRYSDRPSRGSLTYWDIYADLNRNWAEDNSLHHEGASLGASVNLTSEWAFGTYFSSGSWLGARDSSAMLQLGWLTRHLFGGGSAGREVGKRAGQDYAYYWVDQSFTVGPKVVLSCGLERTRFAGDTDSQFTVSGSYEFDTESTLGLWMVGRASDRNLCLTYKRTVRSGSDIYLIYGNPNTLTTQPRIALKLVSPMTW